MLDIWEIAAILSKLALYVGLLSSVGLVMIRAAYPAFVDPIWAHVQTQAIGLAILALLAAVLGFMLRGAALTGGVDGMTDPEMLGLLWTTPVGDVLVYRIVGTLMIALGPIIPRLGIFVSLAGGTLALWSFTQIGHVPELEQIGLRFLLLLHLLAVAFWIGVLGPLRRLSRVPEQLKNASDLGHRFGQAATLIVPVLMLAGALMAWLILGDLTALITTGYGLTLLLKLALVGVILGLAAAHKLRFIPQMRAGDRHAADHFARSIKIETLVMLGVLITTATLTSVMTLPN